MEQNRARVDTKTSYRTPERRRRVECASCGERIPEDEEPVYEAAIEWGGVWLPVHERCSVDVAPSPPIEDGSDGVLRDSVAPSERTTRDTNG